MKALGKIGVWIFIMLFFVVGVSYAQTAAEYYDKGIEYGAQGRFEEAEKEFKKALETDQFFTPAKEGLKLIEDVLEKKVENEVAIHLFKGVAYGSKGMFDEAIAESKKAIAINPNCAEAHLNLGLAYLNKEMLDEAIAEYKKGIAIDPNYADAYNNLGAAYGSKGMFDEAIAELKKAIAIDPNYADAYNNLAATYYRKGQYDLAIEHCDRAIALGGKVHPRLLELLKPYRK